LPSETCSANVTNISAQLRIQILLQAPVLQGFKSVRINFTAKNGGESSSVKALVKPSNPTEE
jgi:hypothetical protein